VGIGKGGGGGGGDLINGTNERGQGGGTRLCLNRSKKGWKVKF